MLEATITSKGQITIPIDLREALGIKTGDKIRFTRRGDDLILSRKKKYTLEDLMNVFPKSKIKLTIKQMDEAIAEAVVARYERSLPKSARRKKK
jgi:antitoxin PrlF